MILGSFSSSSSQSVFIFFHGFSIFIVKRPWLSIIFIMLHHFHCFYHFAHHVHRLHHCSFVFIISKQMQCFQNVSRVVIVFHHVPSLLSNFDQFYHFRVMFIGLCSCFNILHRFHYCSSCSYSVFHMFAPFSSYSITFQTYHNMSSAFMLKKMFVMLCS